MKFRNTCRLFVFVLAAACVVGVVELRLRWHAEAPVAGGPLVGFPVGDVSGLRLEGERLRVECRKREGSWFVVQPVAAPADETQVERILGAVESARRLDVVTPAERKARELTLTDYGLETPRIRLGLSSAAGSVEIGIGSNAVLGDLVYVKRADEGDVVATAGTLRQAIPASADALRERMVLRGKASRVTRLEIHRPGAPFLQVARTEGGWVVQQPAPAGRRADGRRIGRMLEFLFSLRAERFVWDPPVAGGGTPDPAVVCGLAREDAAVRIQIWTEDRPAGIELIFGKAVAEAPDLVYAKNAQFGSIFAVWKGVVEALSVTVDDVRDRALFSTDPANVTGVALRKGDRRLALERKEREGWCLTEPVQWKADDGAVDDFVSALVSLRVEGFADGSETNLARLGLDPPACTAQIVEKTTPGRTNPVARLWIGTPVQGRTNVFARFEEEPVVFGPGASVFEVNATALRAVAADPVNPLVFRDRTMLALSPEAIKRITVRNRDLEETVERDAAHQWTAGGSATNVPVAQTVEDVLFLLCNLRALRIEEDGSRNLAVFGLDRPEMTLTVGLTGESGIQKTLLLGFRSKTDGVYAMIRGEDLVFVLDRRIVERLMRGLTRPRVQPEAGG